MAGADRSAYFLLFQHILQPFAIFVVQRRIRFDAVVDFGREAT